MIDDADQNHTRCHTVLPELSLPLITTLSCLTETLYLLYQVDGWRGQAALWQYRADGALTVYAMTDEDIDRAAAFMDTYRDAPCDFADASLLVAAQRLGLRRVFTLDGHFYAYRLIGGAALEVAPGPARSGG